MVRWKGMPEFVRVVKVGSLSGAARELGVSKAYVSQSLKALEEHLGVRLLERTTRALALTEAGETYYRRCRSLLEQLAEAEEAAALHRGEPRGCLRISLIDGGLGENYLAPAIARFASLYPDLQVKLHFSSRVVDLIEEGFDMAIRVGELRDSSLIARKLASIRHCIYASTAYLERRGTPSSPEDLLHHNCLTGAAPVWIFRKGGETVEVKPRGSWHSKSGQALIAAAREGLGLVRTANFYAKEAVGAGELKSVLEDWTETKTDVWIVYPGGRNLPSKVGHAVEALLEDFRPRAPWE